jgi:hypothetical protein
MVLMVKTTPRCASQCRLRVALKDFLDAEIGSQRGQMTELWAPCWYRVCCLTLPCKVSALGMLSYQF